MNRESPGARPRVPGAALAVALLLGCRAAAPVPSSEAPVPIVSVRSTPGSAASEAARGEEGAVFVDLGGVVLDTQFPAVTPDDIDRLILPGALEGLASVARRTRARIVVVTNQGGVDLGELDEAQVRAQLERLRERARAKGARLDAIYYCPASSATAARVPEGYVSARKPGPGMLLQAARDLGIDLGHSVMVGDTAQDFAAGKAAHPRLVTVGVRTGSGSVDPTNRLAGPDVLVDDLAGVADWLGSRSGQR